MLMALQCVFHHLFLLLLGIVSVSAAFDSPGIALPNCADKCGNVTIPYPFGIGSDCYKNEWFSVTCNKSFDPPKLFLGNIKGAKVLDILLEGTLRINGGISSSCDPSKYSSPNLADNPYLCYSDNGNRFTALGCGVQATISENNAIVGGCMSICNDKSQFNTRRGDGCYGIECCQSMIPHGLKNFTLRVNVTSFSEEIDYSDACKSGFLVDKDWFFNRSFPYPFVDLPKEVPVVLDWTFSAGESCQICGLNSFCLRNKNCLNCICTEGFQGNPYLPQGCVDIDECAKRELNLCVKNCINMPGNYSCSCPSGYHGDGRRDGTGCIENKSWVTPVLIGTGAGVGLLFTILGAIWSYKFMQRRKIVKLKEKNFKRNGGFLLQQKLSSNEGSVEKTKLFTSTDLAVATDNFNENRILGRGGQGTVYKGMLTDGRIVAVKMFKVKDEGQIKQFINEVVILAQIGHRNVVKLLGCCLETEVPLLVYEFIPNGTLCHLIHNQIEEFPMSWEVRLHIAIEVASAIAYLHSAASVPIYHRDIKSSNILLDEKFRAKLSDFGISRSVSLDQTHLTTQVIGSFGYIDPQYFQTKQFTEKSDVYSFGVVLVELLTGKEPICSVGEQEKVGLATCFLSSLEEKNLIDILDARVVNEDKMEELMAVAYLAKRCLDSDGRKRPPMREVAMELEAIMMSQRSKKQLEIDTKKSPEQWDFSSISIEFYSEMTSPAFSEKSQPLRFNTS